jgi:tetratricopeptide (TPR) repeat protein
VPNWKTAKTVYELPSPLYAPGSPILIAGGALLEAEGLLYCRLRLQVIDDVRVRGVTLAVQALDAAGEAMGLELPHRFLGRAGRDEILGEKEPLVLPIDGAASFRLRVLSVLTEAGGEWIPETPFLPLPAQERLETHYGAEDLAEQFRIRYGSDCLYAITPVQDLWRCTCGAVNRAAEGSCHRCHRVRAALEKVSVETLRTESESRARKAPQRREQLAADRRLLRKKLLLWTAVILPVLILVIGLLIAVPREIERRNLYEGAQWLAGIGEFDAARETYLSLGDYRDSAEMAGPGLDYLQACELRRRAEQNDPSALRMIGRTRADLNEDTSAAMLLYEAAQREFEALGDYKDSAAQAARCAEGLTTSRLLLQQAAYDRANTLLESGKLSEAYQAYMELGDQEQACEPVYRKAKALTEFIRRYNIRGVYASLSMEPDDMTRFSMPKDTALTLGSQSVADLLASGGEDPTELQLEDEPAPGMLPLDQAVIELLQSIRNYKDTTELLQAIGDATDHTREFFTLCENGDIFGAYEWLQQYGGSFENREAWMRDLELYMPYCADWALYLGDATVIPLTVGNDARCTSFRARVRIQNGVATLRLTDIANDYSVELYADQGSDRFTNDDNGHCLVALNNAGHFSYLKYNAKGDLASSCEYERVGS